MKIRRLKIHNIASIEDAEIDFSASPLVDTDVFLICGNVGAGKSTILDSVCLALFGGTPRLSPRKKGEESDTVRIMRGGTGIHGQRRQPLRGLVGEAHGQKIARG